MSMVPSVSLGSPRRASVLNQNDRERERALILIFTIAAVGAGALAAIASFPVLAFAGGLLLIAVAAWALPLIWLGPVLGALIPFQFYLPVPATSFTLRAALVFLVAVAVRIVVDRPRSSVGGRRSSVVWLLPAVLFLLAALVAAWGAQDYYAALKGIYDWLVVVLTAMVVAALAPSAVTVRRILSVLIVGGVAQALLGLLQYVLGLDTVLGLLRLPISGLFYQPNLLKDRLGDLSFNWVTFDRALPFGTFINGIDYAVFLAAILSLIIALVIAREQPSAGAEFGGETARAARHCEEPRSGDEAIPDMTEIASPQKLLLATIAPQVSAGLVAPSGGVTNRRQIEPHQPSAVGGQRSLIAHAVGAVPIAIALLLTFKGSGLLALLGGMAAIALGSLSRLSRKTAAIGLVLVVGALAVALPFADLIGQRALFLVQREQGSLSAVGRLQIWAGLSQFVAQRPLFGYGLNNAIALIAPQWTLREGALGFVFSTPESAYVSALVETGLVGFVALAGWLLMAVANGYQRARAARQAAPFVSMVAALLALVFGNLTVSGLTTDQNGMLLGMLVGLIYGSQNDD